MTFYLIVFIFLIKKLSLQLHVYDNVVPDGIFPLHIHMILGDSGTLLTITNLTEKALDCYCEVCMVGYDFSSAFY